MCFYTCSLTIRESTRGTEFPFTGNGSSVQHSRSLFECADRKFRSNLISSWAFFRNTYSSHMGCIKIFLGGWTHEHHQVNLLAKALKEAVRWPWSREEFCAELCPPPFELWQGCYLYTFLSFKKHQTMRIITESNPLHQAYLPSHLRISS